MINHLATHTGHRLHSKLAGQVVSWLAVCIALLWLLWTSVSWFRYHPQLPWRDLFLILDQVIGLAQQPASVATALQWFEPHYAAHRIAVMRALQWLDIALLDGQNRAFYLAGWGSLLLLLALYTRLARQHFPGPGSAIFVAALAVIWLFAPAHLWNLVNPVNISWHLALSLSLLAFWIVLRRTVGRRAVGLRYSDWGLAYLVCTVAAFCNFAGVIAWLLLPLLAWLLQPRAFIACALGSVLLTLLYTQGMASDAALATQWELGTPEVIQQIREQAHSALAANHPWRIMVRSLQFLAWPLSESWPLTAITLSSLSVLAWGVGASQLLLARWRGVVDTPPWLVFCLLAAALCLGIALATQLGRVLQHPNHMHGPSYERYQTVVVLYWLSLSCYLVAAPALLRVPAWIKMLGVLLLAIILQHPGGRYLQQEIQSAEVAARLYSEGERSHLNGGRPMAGNRFTPEYVFSFDAFFAERALAYRVDRARPGLGVDVPVCAAGKVSFINDVMTVGVGAPWFWLSRSVSVYDQQGYLSRLSPSHLGTFSPLSLLRPQLNPWQGQVSGEGASLPLVLVLEHPWGETPWCSIDQSLFSGLAAGDVGD